MKTDCVRHFQLRVLGFMSLLFALIMPPALSADSHSEILGFEHVLDEVLDEKIDILEELLTDPIILASVNQSNIEHQGLSMGDIEALDEAWISESGLNDFMKDKMNNGCAQKLIQFQGIREGFVEIFITDARGLNVCQTNKTTDYYQADEAWWVRSYEDGVGEAYVGEIEYDESAESEAIAIYVPVRGLKSQEVIGVCKAVVDTTAIIGEL